MSERRKPPTEFDAYAVDYAEQLRDPLRERFTASNRFFFVRKLEVIQSFYRRRSVDTHTLAWLDAGCGQGDLLNVAASHFKSAAGCDPSEGMLKACDAFEVKHQTAEDRLPFEDAQFDFVTAVCVYHHVPGERRLALTRELQRVLKPEGIVCIIEHNPLNPVTRLIVSRSPVDADAQLLGVSETKRLVLSVGAQVVESSYFLFFPQSVYAMLAPLERALSSIPMGGQYAVFAQK